MPKSEFTKDTFAKYFADLLQQRNMTTRELFQKTGISRSYLDELKNGTKPAPRRDKLDRLKDAMCLDKCETSQFYFMADQSFAEYKQNAIMQRYQLEQEYEKFSFVKKQKKTRKKGT